MCFWSDCPAIDALAGDGPAIEELARSSAYVRLTTTFRGGLRAYATEPSSCTLSTMRLSPHSGRTRPRAIRTVISRADLCPRAKKVVLTGFFHAQLAQAPLRGLRFLRFSLRQEVPRQPLRRAPMSNNSSPSLVTTVRLKVEQDQLLSVV